MRCPNFMVEEDDHEKIVIRDIGPWDEFPTVTNNAEAVIEKLVRERRLLPDFPGKRVFYFDSDNQLDELRIRDGKFAGFEPGPKGGKLYGSC